jgi:hypothetical protein
MSLSINPGATQFTVTLRPSQFAAQTARESHQSGFGSRVVRLPWVPMIPETLETLMIRPYRARIMCGETARANRNAPVRLVVNDLVPLFVGHSRQQRIPCHTGIVDQNIHFCPIVQRRFRRPIYPTEGRSFTSQANAASLASAGRDFVDGLVQFALRRALRTPPGPRWQPDRWQSPPDLVTPRLRSPPAPRWPLPAV